MPLAYVLANPCLELLRASLLRRPGEDGGVNFGRRISAGATDDDLIALILPFEHRTRSETEFLADFDGH